MICEKAVNHCVKAVRLRDVTPIEWKAERMRSKQRQQQLRHRHRLALEGLEDRRMLAFETVHLLKDINTAPATSFDNQIT